MPNNNLIWLVWAGEGDESRVVSAWSTRGAAQKAARAITDNCIDDADGVKITSIPFDCQLLPKDECFMAILYTIKPDSRIGKEDVDVCLANAYFYDKNRKSSKLAQIKEGWEHGSVNVYANSNDSPQDAIKKCLKMAKEWQAKQKEGK